jgi:hypothetical protein
MYNKCLLGFRLREKEPMSNYIGAAILMYLENFKPGYIYIVRHQIHKPAEIGLRYVKLPRELRNDLYARRRSYGLIGYKQVHLAIQLLHEKKMEKAEILERYQYLMDKRYGKGFKLWRPV